LRRVTRRTTASIASRLARSFGAFASDLKPSKRMYVRVRFPGTADVLRVVGEAGLLPAEEVQRAPAQVGRDRLARVGRMPIRLLGDAVLRRRAWELADQLGWASTYDAEYIALTQLQADAFVTLDAELARSVEGIVATASIDELR
jgi:predicted nucleic acid-binding protein